MATSFTKIDRSNLQIDFAHYVTREDIKRFQDQFEELAINRFPRALQFALNKTSRDAQEALADAVEAAFDRPVPFTRVNPDDLRRTSIRRWNRRIAKDQEVGMKDVESKVYVMRKQSAYFKFALGERKRMPGDIGLAEDYIGIPYWPNLIEMQGINPTREGNLPSGAMRTLARRKSKSTMNRKEFGELTLGRGHHTVFFGRPRRGGKDGQLGWYDRPEAQYQRTGPVITRGKNKGKKRLERITDTGSPRLLIAAHKSTEHDPILVAGWNKAIEYASERMHIHMRRELQDRLQHLGRAMPESAWKPADGLSPDDFFYGFEG